MTQFYLMQYFYYICRKIKIIMEENNETKQERTVIHLYLKGSNSHHYFGSMASIFEFYNKETINITFGSLRNFKLSAENPYENKLVIIRKGIILTKESPNKRLAKRKRDLEYKELKNNTIFDKPKLERYLSSNLIYTLKNLKRKLKVKVEKTEYQELIMIIVNLHYTSSNYPSVNLSDTPDYKKMLEILSKICDDENEIDKYKKLIEDKLSKNKKSRLFKLKNE